MHEGMLGGLLDAHSMSDLALTTGLGMLLLVAPEASPMQAGQC